MAHLCAAEGMADPLPHSVGHENTLQRVKRIVAFLRHNGASDLTALKTIALAYAPSTAISYIRNAVSLQVANVSESKFRGLIKYLHQKKSRNKPVQAKPIKAVQLKSLLNAQIPQPIKDTLVLMWVSASRHADLTHMIVMERLKIKQSSVARVMLDMTTFKSDIDGEEYCRKVIILPSSLASRLPALLENLPTYRKVYNTLSQIGLSSHSVRVGAMKFLSGKVTDQEILALTQHASSRRADAKAARIYLRQVALTEEGKTQMRLSQILLSAITV